MKNWNIRTFGLRGSWKWACLQMARGYIIQHANTLGAVKYKLDDESQRRIIWTHKDDPKSNSDWDNANIFLSTFESTDWEKWKVPKEVV